MRNFIYSLIIIPLFLSWVAPALAALEYIPAQNRETVKTNLHFQDMTFSVPSETVASWAGLAAWNEQQQVLETHPDLSDLIRNFSGNQTPQQKQTRYINSRPKAIYEYLQTVSSQINKPTQTPQITISENHVDNFIPPQDGLSLDLYKSTAEVIRSLSSGQTDINLSVNINKPNVSLSELNNLGIEELIGHGISSFKGSPKNRKHNITIGVEKMKGIIIPPGGIFSFNHFLGPVDGEHGFLPELVIKKEGTVPEFGGGLCQVSSTTFRAAMDAGLPISERRNHAYAVQYYAPQGTDATIYPGVVDLKFINDTPGHLLIWPTLKDKDTLVFDFYGTKDDRQVTLEKPIQYDRKADGSLKASWTRIVVKDGETSTSTFKSTYQSPALFHKQEQFVSTSTPLTISSTQ